VEEYIIHITIWVKLLALPMELWEEDILKSIGNNIGMYMDIGEKTKNKEHTIVAIICIQWDIREDYRMV